MGKSAAQGEGELAKPESGGGVVSRVVGIVGAGLTGMMLGAVVWGLVWGVPWLERAASERELVRAAEAGESERLVVEVNWPPLASGEGTWLPEEFQRELVGIVRSTVEGSDKPFRDESLRLAGERLLKTGWFEEVRGVQRARVGGRSVVRVEGVWRVPAAVVRVSYPSGERDLLVASGGELLPPDYPAGKTTLPVVLGVRQGPPRDERGRPAYGERWSGGDVQSAIALMGLMRGQPWWGQVRGVRVSRNGEDRRLSLVTDKGTEVVWGSAPGEMNVAEQTTETKLKHMRIVWDTFKRIDGGRDRIEVFDRLVVVDTSAGAAGKP